MDKSKMLDEIKAHYKLKKDSEFARHLGIIPQTLSNWKKRESFDAELIFEKCPEINPAWLLSGEGDMLLDMYPGDDEYEINLIKDETNIEVLRNKLIYLIGHLRAMNTTNKALEEANESMKETKDVFKKRIEELEERIK